MKRPITPERLFAKLEEVWREARGARALPRREDINPIKLGAALQYVSLIDVVPSQPVDFRYRLLGQQIIKHFGHNITGELHTHHADKTSPTRPFYDAYVRCIATKAAQDIEAQYRNYNKTIVRTRARVWPLSDDDKTVSALLGGGMFLTPALN